MFILILDKRIIHLIEQELDKLTEQLTGMICILTLLEFYYTNQSKKDLHEIFRMKSLNCKIGIKGISTYLIHFYLDCPTVSQF